MKTNPLIGIDVDDIRTIAIRAIDGPIVSVSIGAELAKLADEIDKDLSAPLEIKFEADNTPTSFITREKRDKEYYAKRYPKHPFGK